MRSRPLQAPCAALLGIALLAGAARAQLQVLSTDPAAAALSAATNAPLLITFDQPVDAASLTPGSARIFGRWSGVHEWTLGPATAGALVELRPSRPFFPGELVTVALSSAVQSSGASALTSGHAWSFWTAAAPGTGIFALASVIDLELAGESGIRAYGVYSGDLNRDGAVDLSIPCEDSDDVRVLMGDGCGGFGPVQVIDLPISSTPSSNEGADLDADGWIDFVTGHIGGSAIGVFRNDGAGAYLAPAIYPSGIETRGVCVLDADADGDTDVVTANRAGSNLAFHRNLGDGTFATSVKFDAGGSQETSVGAGDADGDGICDLWSANYGSSSVTLLLGSGAATWSLSATSALTGSPWMIALGDVDADGDLDAVTCNWSTDRAAVCRGNGAGGFSGPAQHYVVGNFPLAIDLGDLEGDADLDLVTSNYFGGTWTVLRNNGAGGYGGASTLAAQIAGSCLTFVDYDRDGDMDLVGVDEEADKVMIFRQASLDVAGVQAASCSATLRVNGIAGQAGFGASAAHPWPVGWTGFLGVSGKPLAPYGIAVGSALEPGLALPWGVLNLAAPLLVIAGATDLHGEAVVSVALAPGTAAGPSASLQGYVVDLADPDLIVLTNPESVVLVP
jgi:hypothetical protein